MHTAVILKLQLCKELKSELVDAQANASMAQDELSGAAQPQQFFAQSLKKVSKGFFSLVYCRLLRI